MILFDCFHHLMTSPCHLKPSIALQIFIYIHFQILFCRFPPRSLLLPRPGSSIPLPGWLEASPAGHSAGQRSGLQHLPTEGRSEWQLTGGLWGQDAQQSPADQHNTQVYVCVYLCFSWKSALWWVQRRIFLTDQSTLFQRRIGGVRQEEKSSVIEDM